MTGGGERRRMEETHNSPTGHLHLHVSEALDAEHGCVLCGEQYVGLFMESCGDTWVSPEGCYNFSLLTKACRIKVKLQLF